MINLDALVGQAFDIIDTTAPDVVERATYLESAYRTYDSAARSYVTGLCEHTEIPMVFARPSLDEIDGSDVQHSSVKILIAADKLPGVTPKISDKVRKENGTVYNLTKIVGVPGESLHILFGEATQE